MQTPSLISVTDLDRVTGGTGSTSSTPTTSTTSSSDPNAQVMAALQGIESSISDLGKHQNQLFGSNTLLFMTMALAMQRREVVVYGGGGWGWHHHYW